MGSKPTRQLVPAEKQASVFWEFERSAFRVETLPAYAVVDDDHVFKNYMEGGGTPPFDDPGWKDWYSRVRSATEAGKEMIRVHLVPEVLTPYLRYEIEWAYSMFNAAAGETVMLVNIDRHPQLKELRGTDFYLFDDRRVLLINFDEQNKLVNMETDQDPQVIERYRRLKEEILSAAVPLEEYLRRMRSAELRVPF